MSYTNLESPCLTSQRQGIINSFENAEGVKIYEGSIVVLSSGKANYEAGEGDLFAGIAANTSEEMTVVYSEGVFPFEAEGLSEEDVGKVAYLDTAGNPNKIITEVTSGDLKLALGIIAEAPVSTLAKVYITGYAMRETAIETEEED